MKKKVAGIFVNSEKLAVVKYKENNKRLQNEVA